MSRLLAVAAILIPTSAWGLEVDSSEVTLPATTSATTELWESITFGTAFTDVPVVITSPGPSTGGQPFTIRIQNVTTTGFEAQIVEAEGTSGPTHYAVDMTYIAMEEGVHGLPDGSLIVVGTTSTTAEQYAPNHGLTGSWETVSFGASYASAPVVLTQVQTTVNETGAVPVDYSTPFYTVAVESVTTTGFDAALERSEATTGTTALDEDIGWIAITPNTDGSLTATDGSTVLWESLLIPAASTSIGKDDGCTTESLSASFASTAPAVVSLNSRNESDGGWAIVCSLSTTQIGYAIDEDWYYDSERSHVGEEIGALLFESGIIDLDLDADDDGIDDTVEDSLGTDSADPDSDGDGWCDGVVDVSPDCVAGEDAASGTDSDGDGVLDALETDSDNDGVLDSAEDFTTDVDGDGLPTIQDPDDDGDTVLDGVDACPGYDDTVDSDSDGVADGCDPCPLDPLDDADGDGVCADIDPCPLDNPDDSDGDSVCDTDDVCPGYDDLVDTDADGVPDGCDPCPLDDPDDSDGDGICDTDDVCPGFDDLTDTDGDSVPDGCDVCPLDNPDDSDGDGVCDSDDLCPGFDDTLDGDSDGVADGCDPCPVDPLDDSDGDGSCDSDDLCPGFDDTVDVDGDAQPDACDPCPLDNPDDSDGDSVCDSDDICEGGSDFDDEDGDLVPDFCDVCWGHDWAGDTDGDGTCDDLDVCPNDPLDDEDEDGVCGDEDACPGYDDSIDADGDGQPWGCDPCPLDNPDDTDGDEICDSDDLCWLDPLNDEDDDGYCGDIDNCPETPNEDQADLDEDGIGDACDPEDDRPDTGDPEDTGDTGSEDTSLPRDLAGGWDCSGCSTGGGNPRTALYLLPCLGVILLRRRRRTSLWGVAGALLLTAPLLMGADGQTYRVPLGDTYTLLDSPMRAEQGSFRAVGGYAWAPLVLRAEETGLADDMLLEHLVHGDFRYQRRIGTPKAGLVLGGDVPIRYAKDYIGGMANPRLSVGFTGHTPWVGAVIRGSGILPTGTEGSPWGVEGEATVGLYRPQWGVAVGVGGIYRPEEPAFRTKAGFYLGPESARFTSEWVGEFGVHSPSEVIVGGRFQKGLVVVSPALGIGVNGEAGTPRLRGLLSLSIQQPAPAPPPPPVEPLPVPEAQVVSLPDSVFGNLSQVAEVLVVSPDLKIRVEIHAQSKWEPAEAEQRISALERTVTEYLVGEGVDPARISVEARGVTGSDWIDIVVTE